MSLRKLGWNLGLTRETIEELSDILYETATVVSKDHEEGEVYSWLWGSVNPALGFLWAEDEEYNISFRGERTSFDLDDEKLFKAFKTGETVKLGYTEVYELTYDYIPPAFDRKQFLGKRLKGYRFVNATKK